MKMNMFKVILMFGLIPKMQLRGFMGLRMRWVKRTHKILLFMTQTQKCSSDELR